MRRRRRRVILTGAWGGGKTTLLSELQANSDLAGKFLFLPEAAPLARRMGFDVGSPRFQAAVVQAQHALEDVAEVRDGLRDDRIVISHRGSLDALAFWRLGDGESCDFFDLVESTRDAEFARYDVVLLFQTCAGGVPEVYESYRNHQPRPAAAEAARLEGLLEECWGCHPGFHRLVNGPNGWAEKSATAHRIIAALLQADARMD